MTTFSARFVFCSFSVLLLVACSIPFRALAEDVSDEKPFASHHLMLQISDADPAKYDAVLNVANNLIRHYGNPDEIDIEVVAFAQGVQMLKAAGNANRTRIESLLLNGVRFYICENTLETIEQRTGQSFEFLEGVRLTRTGVAHILERRSRDFELVRP